MPRAELSQILARVAWRGRERARVQIVGIPRDLPVYAPQQLEMREHLDEVPQSIAKPFRFAGAVALGQYFEGAGSRRESVEWGEKAEALKRQKSKKSS